MRNLEHEIPGFLGLAGDIRSRVAAVGEGNIPAAWTPEHVGARLVEAFEILSRSGTRVGPGRVGNGWPAMVHEFADMVDAQARSLAEKEKQQARAARPTADELSRMNEALAWPMAYLDGKALAADSLMLWAYASATGRDMAGMLNHRRKRAVVLAERMAQERNRLPFGTGPNGEGDTRSMAMQWRAALRQQIVAEVAAAVPAARAQRELVARLTRAGCMPYRFKPHEAVPGRALARTTLDRYRKRGMAYIADGLRRAGVAVR